MTEFEVRAGSTDDLPAVMTIMGAAFDPRFGEAWSANQCLGLMTLPGAALRLVDAATPLGFALSRTIAGECELMMLGVLPSAQRRGIGKILLNHVILEARAHGASAVFLEVRAGNPAIDLYHGSNFIKVGSRPRYYRGNSGEVFDAATYRYALM
jgi:[ribosomal protein S18]-alanine N-acetyltransferase